MRKSNITRSRATRGSAQRLQGALVCSRVGTQHWEAFALLIRELSAVHNVDEPGPAREGVKVAWSQRRCIARRIQLSCIGPHRSGTDGVCNWRERLGCGGALSGCIAEQAYCNAECERSHTGGVYGLGPASQLKGLAVSKRLRSRCRQNADGPADLQSRTSQTKLVEPVF